MFYNVFLTEWMKIRKSSIWVPVLAIPLVTWLIGYLILKNGNVLSWDATYQSIVFFYAILFLPMLAGILSSLSCRNEHLSGGWKQLLTLPVSRSSIYLSKFFVILILMALIQILVLLVILFNGLVIFQLHAPVPWFFLAKGFVGGWLAVVPLVALQLWVSTIWKSFGAPFALNIVLTIPAAAVASSKTYGPIYPWTQPMLAMVHRNHGLLNVTTETISVITLSGVAFIIAGWIHFTHRDFLS